MSCPGKCNSAGNTPPPRGGPTNQSAPAASHTPVHISMEKVPSRRETGPSSQHAEYSSYVQNIRNMPPMLFPQSTPLPYHYEAYGYVPNYDRMDWTVNRSKDSNIAGCLETGRITPKFPRENQIGPGSSVIHDKSYGLDDIQNVNNSDKNAPISDGMENSLLRNLKTNEEITPKSQQNRKERGESLMEWFDRSVEKELKKHNETEFDTQFTPIARPPLVDPELNFSKGTLERLSGASASQIEICLDLRRQPDTDLSVAVDKYAKAQAMCEFAKAVRAAEAATVSAPPEMVEEAALASARGYQTNVIATGIEQELEGVRPIEVVGYVGVTKPKYPTKRL